MDLSKTQIDRLGERLKAGPLIEEDLILLDKYRLSFGDAYKFVVNTLNQELRELYPSVKPSGREAKTKNSIIQKLLRESIRLTQIQDIAGCRLVVPKIADQDLVVSTLSCSVFSTATVIDRRAKPSHGYRAVHIIAKISGKPIEIQVRSQLQDLWAELSEKLSDIDHSIKYGGGNDIARAVLAKTSHFISIIEESEKRFAQIFASPPPMLEKDLDLQRIWQEEKYYQERIFENLNKIIITTLEKLGKMDAEYWQDSGR